jgi:uncharacterized protein YegL
MGRRKLLKALAAGGGAIAVTAIVPGKWAKPVIEAGLLPAHAQASPTPTPIRANPISCDDVDGVDINLALDRSWSMNPDSPESNGEDLFKKAQDAAIAFTNKIDFTANRVAVTAFAGSTSPVITLSSSSSEVISAINSLAPEGWNNSGTNITSAVQKAQQLLDSSLSARYAPVLILMSDGMHNHGNPRPVAQANAAKLQNIRVITIGLGSNADQQTLRDMASQTSDYYYAPTADDLEAIYVELAESVFCISGTNWSHGTENGVEEKTYPNTRRDGSPDEDNESRNRSSSSEEDDPIGAGPSR